MSIYLMIKSLPLLAAHSDDFHFHFHIFGQRFDRYAGASPVSIPLYLSNFVINIPLLIIALVIKGRAFLGRTCVATILLSLFLFLTQKWAYDSADEHPTSTLLSSVAATTAYNCVISCTKVSSVIRPSAYRSRI